MTHHERIGLPNCDGWIVRLWLKAQGMSDAPIDLVAFLRVTAGEPVRMLVPDGVDQMVVTICVDGSKGEHTVLPMLRVET